MPMDEAEQKEYDKMKRAVEKAAKDAADAKARADTAEATAKADADSHASALALARAGITDPDDADTIVQRYQRIPEADRPTDGIAAWLADDKGAKADRIAGRILTDAAKGTGGAGGDTSKDGAKGTGGAGGDTSKGTKGADDTSKGGGAGTKGEPPPVARGEPGAGWSPKAFPPERVASMSDAEIQKDRDAIRRDWGY